MTHYLSPPSVRIGRKLELDLTQAPWHRCRHPECTLITTPNACSCSMFKNFTACKSPVHAPSPSCVHHYVCWTRLWFVCELFHFVHVPWFLHSFFCWWIRERVPVLGVMDGVTVATSAGGYRCVFILGVSWMLLLWPLLFVSSIALRKGL